VNDLTELRSLIARHAAGEMGPKLMNGLLVARTDAPSPPVHSVHQPVFAIVAQGAKRIVLAQRVFDARAGQYSVVPLDLPLTFRVTEASNDAPYLAVALLLNPQIIAA